MRTCLGLYACLAYLVRLCMHKPYSRACRHQSSAFLKKPVKSAALFSILEEANRTIPVTKSAPPCLETEVMRAASAPPLVRRNSEKKVETEPKAPPPRHALRILVAEDNPSNQFVLRKYLVRGARCLMRVMRRVVCFVRLYVLHITVFGTACLCGACVLACLCA